MIYLLSLFIACCFATQSNVTVDEGSDVKFDCEYVFVRVNKGSLAVDTIIHNVSRGNAGKYECFSGNGKTVFYLTVVYKFECKLYTPRRYVLEGDVVNVYQIIRYKGVNDLKFGSKFYGQCSSKNRTAMNTVNRTGHVQHIRMRLTDNLNCSNNVLGYNKTCSFVKAIIKRTKTITITFTVMNETVVAYANYVNSVMPANINMFKWYNNGAFIHSGKSLKVKKNETYNIRCVGFIKFIGVQYYVDNYLQLP